MKYCIRCGRRLADHENFCTGCGLKQPVVPPEVLNASPAVQPEIEAVQRLYAPPVAVTALVPVVPAAVQDELPSAVPSLIWSLILVVFYNPIGMPLAFISALFSVIANAEQNIFKRKRHLFLALVLCTAATIVDIVTLIFLIVAAIPFFHAKGL